MMARVLFFVLLAGTLLPWVSAPWALLAGVCLGLSLGNPFPAAMKLWSTRCLQLSVIGLGAGINLETVARVGAQGLGYTVAGIALTGGLGWLLQKTLRTDSEVSILLTSGTAICGGSAIAAVSSAIGAEAAKTSVALAIVFLLNGAALFLFPPLGHWLELAPREFALWSALAIHDTSSVVGAAMQFGEEALAIATTVKLARALWIAPLAFFLGLVRARKQGAGGFKKPWFILGFLVASALVTWIPALAEPGQLVAAAARRGLVISLFLIGTGLTPQAVKKVGARPFAQAVLLWVIVSVLTLLAIRQGWVH